MGLHGKTHNWCVLNKLGDWFQLNEFNKFVWFYIKWTGKFAVPNITANLSNIPDVDLDGNVDHPGKLLVWRKSINADKLREF